MNDLKQTHILMITICLPIFPLRTGPDDLSKTHSNVFKSILRREWGFSLNVSCMPSMQPPETDWRYYFENMIINPVHIVINWLLKQRKNIAIKKFLNAMFDEKDVAINMAHPIFQYDAEEPCLLGALWVGYIWKFYYPVFYSFNFYLKVL